MTTKRIKCRWCDKTFAKWRTGADGKLKDGWKSIASHIEDYHFDEAIAEGIATEDEGVCL